MQVHIFCTKKNLKQVKTLLNNLSHIFKSEVIFLNMPMEDYYVYRDIISSKQILFDETLLDDKLEQKLSKSSRPGWNRQQIIKLLQFDKNLGDTLIIDGDTVLSIGLLKQILTKNFRWYCRENPEQYLKLIKKCDILEEYIDPFTHYSFITNFSVFRKMDYEKINIRDLIDILLDFETTEMPISEYQMNGMLNAQAIDDRKIKIFRRADLLCAFSTRFLLNYDCYAYEYHHDSSISKKIAANIAVILGYTW